MNILQLLTSLNDEIAIRAIASHSKILKNNQSNSYVFAPLGRELSYFKRWGAEIASSRNSSVNINYSKVTIKEICDIVSKNLYRQYMYMIWQAIKLPSKLKKFAPSK